MSWSGSFMRFLRLSNHGDSMTAFEVNVGLMLLFASIDPEMISVSENVPVVGSTSAIQPLVLAHHLSYVMPSIWKLNPMGVISDNALSVPGAPAPSKASDLVKVLGPVTCVNDESLILVRPAELSMSRVRT